jgi:hypothetical protein
MKGILLTVVDVVVDVIVVTEVARRRSESAARRFTFLSPESADARIRFDHNIQFRCSH